MSNFDEKSGIISHKTQFGSWHQTVSEVTILVQIESGTRGKQCKVEIKPKSIKCQVKDKIIFQGKLYSTVIEDESVWTIEDQKLLRIQLVKADERTKDNCWISLLENQFIPDVLTLTEMRKKLDLERFQIENPGFDFSGAKLDKSYENKGIEQMQNVLDSMKN